MKHHYISVATLLAMVMFSCNKQDSRTGKPIEKSPQSSIYQKFVDSLDRLTEEQRQVAINNYDSHNSQNRATDKNTISSTNVGPTDPNYWSELTNEIDYNTTNYKMTESVWMDLGYYTDQYKNIYGFLQNINGPTKIMAWTMAQNYFNIWVLKSHEQFVGGNCMSDPVQGCKFLGVKHKYSGVEGVTTYVAWQEKLNDCQLSNQGYAAYTHVEGQIYFTFKAWQSNKSIGGTNFWTYDDVF